MLSAMAIERARRATIALVVVAGLVGAGDAAAVGERPTEADLAACSEFARLQPGVPAYTETAPTSPFPSRVSSVGPWTGPITGARAPRPVERPLTLAPVEVPAASGEFGAGGSSQAAMSEPGPYDPRFKEAFDACLRARGF